MHPCFRYEIKQPVGTWAERVDHHEARDARCLKGAESHSVGYRLHPEIRSPEASGQPQHKSIWPPFQNGELVQPEPATSFQRR